MGLSELVLPTWPINQVPPAAAKLFIALWPTADTVQAIQQQSPIVYNWATGRALPAAHWHITLAYMGRCSAVQWDNVSKGFGGLVIPTVAQLQLEAVGHFEQAQVIYLQVAANRGHYPQLQRAYQQLWAQLDPWGWQPEDRPYVPHVSLLRRAQYQWPAPAWPTVPWQSRCLKLIVSMAQPQGSTYFQVAEQPIAKE